MKLGATLLVLAVLGTVVPWIFFGAFITQSGLDVGGFVSGLFATAPAGGFTADLLISSLTLWIWAYFDSRAHNVRLWWLVIPANLLVGLSLALPLYLLLRLNAMNRPADRQEA